MAGVLIQHATRLGVPVPCHRLLHALVTSKSAMPPPPPPPTLSETSATVAPRESFSSLLDPVPLSGATVMPLSLHLNGKASSGERTRAFTTLAAAQVGSSSTFAAAAAVMQVHSTVAGVRAFREEFRDSRLGFVPTMGGLHEGSSPPVLLANWCSTVSCVGT